MILLTGAAGKTGRAILRALGADASHVRAFVRSDSQGADLEKHGIAEYFVGDLTRRADLNQALQGVERLYFICPNVSAEEMEIGNQVLQAARDQGVSHFVYHSVLHPQIESMPHHWQKMRVEEAVINSGMNFTILQPCAYMQNVLGGWRQINEESVFSVPYSLEARISMVDLEDVGSVAAKVLTENGHKNAIYELSGPEALSQREVADCLGQALGKLITAVEIDRQKWSEKASQGLGQYEVETLLKMFEYYDQHGLLGNSTVLRLLLDREPIRFSEFIEMHIKSEGR